MLLRTFFIGILLALSSLALAQDQIYTSAFNNRAVGGYDVVSYFLDSGPVKGNKKYRTQHLGAEWRFSSEENLNTFVAEPEKYVPEFGGYCAYAASQGSIAKGDPLQWTIHNEKLYLNYNAAIKEKWRADIENYIELADQKWPALIK